MYIPRGDANHSDSLERLRAESRDFWRSIVRRFCGNVAAASITADLLDRDEGIRGTVPPINDYR